MTHDKRSLRRTAAFATLLLAAMSTLPDTTAFGGTAAVNRGGPGGAGGPGNGAGGANSDTAPGSNGGSVPGISVGAGGGGAGVTGGNGGSSNYSGFVTGPGGITPISGVVPGGTGGAAPGANGSNGTSSSDIPHAMAGGGGGGGGGAHGFVGAALPGVAVKGGNGGDGGDVAGIALGGGGGAGGYGAVVTSSGNLGTLNSNVTGGTGGAGGRGDTWGDGGSGGIGLKFTNAAGATFTVNSAVRGGDGGDHHPGRLQYNAAGGAGGEGIVGQNLNITMGAGGSVTAGVNADVGFGSFPVPAPNAITFTGGVNSLSFVNATSGITGNIGVTGSLSLNKASGSVAIDNIITGTGSIMTSGPGTVVLSGVNTYTGGTTLAAGTLRVANSNALGTGDVTTTGAVVLDYANGVNLANKIILKDSTNTTQLQVLSGVATQSGTISFEFSFRGSGSVEKIGTGTLVQTASARVAVTTITAGTWQAGAANIFGNPGFAEPIDPGVNLGGYTVAAGATLDLHNFNQTVGRLDGAGNVTLGTATLSAYNGNFSGVISGTGGLTLFAPVSTLGFGVTLTNANTYTGGTVIIGVPDFQGFLSLGNGGTTGSILGNVSSSGILVFNRSNTYQFDGIISGIGNVRQVGTGNTILTANNTYTGTTTVSAGTLSVNGSIASSSLTTVNAGATLGGNGTVGNTTISGGTLAPGNSIGALTVQGNLVFTTAASYMVEVSPANADRTNVTGTATLGGATVKASFAAGTYVSKQYTILNATGGVSGTFNGPVNTDLPANFKSSLSYDANNAYLNLALNFIPPPGSGLSGNQQNVANAIVGFFNTNGGIPLVFGGLTAAGLTQISGETAVGSQQTTFNAMGMFTGLLTDPFIDGRGDPVNASAGATQFADENDTASAYAANGKPRTKSERDAYAAIVRKAPVMADPFAQRWSVWAAGYGGSQTTDGNTAQGSNNTTSRIYGTAVGADYRFSPNTIAGFALAGGGTNFSVANGGTGRSDLFQAGGFIRHNVGPAYIAGALAYGWQDVTTDRTVALAGLDLLRARFNANAYSGRVEGGYRFVTPWVGMGLTPYAAGQFTTFELPAYAEGVVAGANTFALSYAAKDVTASRSELGLRSDKSFAMSNSIFTLRGRAAWAHDFNPDRSISATFQTLPGASFVVNGASQARDAALVTGSAEMKWLNGFSLAATFEGEFSNVARSYAGKGVARYQW